MLDLKKYILQIWCYIFIRIITLLFYFPRHTYRCVCFTYLPPHLFVPLPHLIVPLPRLFVPRRQTRGSCPVMGYFYKTQRPPRVPLTPLNPSTHAAYFLVAAGHILVILSSPPPLIFTEWIKSQLQPLLLIADLTLSFCRIYRERKGLASIISGQICNYFFM